MHRVIVTAPVCVAAPTALHGISVGFVDTHYTVTQLLWGIANGVKGEGAASTRTWSANRTRLRIGGGRVIERH